MRFRNSAITLVCNKVTSPECLVWRAFSRNRDPDLRHSQDAFSLNRIFLTANVSALSICSKVTNPSRSAPSRVFEMNWAIL